ncbi:ribonuclease P protein component [Rhodobacteraceae bacterium NNCM2]|nr:ribonuclease P protein component [Coraliihabitans acroporae]
MQGADDTTATDPTPDGEPRAGVHVSGPPPDVIRKRRDFLACARARKWVAPGMIVQGRARGDDTPPRVGYTCSKKVGNAVARNRAKRRLREAARAVIAAEGRTGWDYVLIGRAEATASRPFTDLVGDLTKALSRLHQPPKGRK